MRLQGKRLQFLFGTSETHIIQTLSRIEYDAYRSDLEALLQNAANGQSSALTEAQIAHDEHKAEFEKLRADVSVKLKFLNENRVKVCSRLKLLDLCLIPFLKP